MKMALLCMPKAASHKKSGLTSCFEVCDDRSNVTFWGLTAQNSTHSKNCSLNAKQQLLICADTPKPKC